jgi:carboxyl-terminal processing protease
MQGAVDIASDFLPEGTLVVVEDSKVYGRSEYKTKGIPQLAKYKVVILVDGGSASASEILAAALREQAKIKIVGEKSFGKGTIQEPRDLSESSGIHITIGKWLTPKGEWLNEKGLEPDVVVVDNPDTKEDEQLEKAIEIVDNL